MRLFFILLILTSARADDTATALLKRALPELRAASAEVTAKVDLTDPSKFQVEISPAVAEALQRRAQLVADIEQHLRKFRYTPTLRK